LNLYLDTEFDGHGGALASLALAGDDDSQWYGIFDAYCGDPWVAENVAPKFYAMKPTISGDQALLRFSLREYLTAREGCAIWADWPVDFEYLMQAMRGGHYGESFMMPCTMHLIVTPPGEPQPEFPHNALSDALALMKWHKSLST
jgi:hypothetical protein